MIAVVIRLKPLVIALQLTIDKVILIGKTTSFH
jgi:hypothetical protein